MSEFLSNTLADFLGSVFAGVLLVGVCVVIQWFLAATDVEIGYTWSFHGTIETPTELWVNLDVRNRSRSKTYYVANIAYMKGRSPVAAFDNRSIWGTELKPGTITFLDGAPVQGFSSLKIVLTPKCMCHCRTEDSSGCKALDLDNTRGEGCSVQPSGFAPG